jgi:hypothetical protein
VPKILCLFDHHINLKLFDDYLVLAENSCTNRSNEPKGYRIGRRYTTPFDRGLILYPLTQVVYLLSFIEHDCKKGPVEVQEERPSTNRHKNTGKRVLWD